jgi:hypothetical protein
MVWRCLLNRCAIHVWRAGLSYQLAPRAKISRRDQGTVDSLDMLKQYIRSNSWATEPYSDGSPFGAICGRGDLDMANPKASGCNDAKVSSVVCSNQHSVQLHQPHHIISQHHQGCCECVNGCWIALAYLPLSVILTAALCFDNVSYCR